MATFFNGWLGYGTAVQFGTLVEPSDATYARRPFVLGDVDDGSVYDVGSGTVGPATVAWGTIVFTGIFDAQSSGNLLLWFPLPQPLNVLAGATITTGTRSHHFSFPDLRRGGQATFSWPGGVTIGSTAHGRSLTTGVALQVVGGRLAAQSVALGTTVAMGSLPSAQPQTGTGLLWNNGGVISVA